VTVSRQGGELGRAPQQSGGRSVGGGFSGSPLACPRLSAGKVNYKGKAREGKGKASSPTHSEWALKPLRSPLLHPAPHRVAQRATHPPAHIASANGGLGDFRDLRWPAPASRRGRSKATAKRADGRLT